MTDITIGTFVTAKLKDMDHPVQGWISSLHPLRVRGMSGTIYECEGSPVVVDNPPPRGVKLTQGSLWYNVRLMVHHDVMVELPEGMSNLAKDVAMNALRTTLNREVKPLTVEVVIPQVVEIRKTLADQVINYEDANIPVPPSPLNAG